MKRIAWLVVSIICISMVGCTTLRPVAYEADHAPVPALATGDHLVLQLKDGTALSAYVVSSDADGVTVAEAKSSTRRTLGWSQIASIEREEVSGRKLLRDGVIVLLVMAAMIGSGTAY